MKSASRRRSAPWKLPKPLASALRLCRSYNWVETTFFVVGLVSLIGILVLLFLPIGKGPAMTVASDTVPAAGSENFMGTISNAMTLPLGHGATPEVMVNGDAFLARLLPDIDAAKHSINFMVYIWKDGRLSDTILSHLEKAQRAGVQVRVMYDAYGGIGAPTRKFAQLQQLGGRVMPFHSLLPLPWTVSRAPKRNHRRSIVIDGGIAYTGGIAVDDVWLGDAANPKQWHDIMLRVQGGMAARLQGSFAEIWAAETGEMLTGDRFYPIEAAGGGASAYLALSTSPSPDLYEAQTFFLLSLLGARHDIAIETPYFLPDASVRKVLMDKAKAGVDVRILVPNERTDEKSVRWAGQRIYQELLEAGVRIYEYQPTFTHTKMLLEDGTWSVVGSANLDNRSRKINDEVVLGLSDPVLNGKLHAIYDADLARSKEITLGDWKQRGPMQRILEIVCQAFVQQY